MAINDQILNDFLLHSVNLQRVGEDVRLQAVAFLKELELELVDKVTAGGVIPYTKARLEAMIEQNRATIASAYGNVNNLHSAKMLDLAEVEVKFGSDILRSRIANILPSVVITQTDLEKLVGNVLIDGAPSSAWWNKQSSNLQDAFTRQIRMGYAQGESVDDMVRRVRGTWTGKKNQYIWNDEPKWYFEFAGGVMDTGTRQAEALVRTSVQSVAAAARLETFQQNKDVIKSLMWLSTLDLRTTPLCQARDHKQYTLKGEPIGHNVPFLSGPPAHWNCRSTLVPLTKSFQDLADEANGKPLGDRLGEIPPGTRASMNGAVPAQTSYEEWFKGLNEDQQKSVLGKGRYDLWKQNGLSFTDMVDQSGNPLSLKSLRSAYGMSDKVGASLTPSGIAYEQVEDLKTFRNTYRQQIRDLEKSTDPMHKQFIKSLYPEKDQLLHALVDYEKNQIQALLVSSRLGEPVTIFNMGSAVAGAEKTILQDFVRNESSLGASHFLAKTPQQFGTMLEEWGWSDAGGRAHWKQIKGAKAIEEFVGAATPPPTSFDFRALNTPESLKSFRDEFRSQIRILEKSTDPQHKSLINSFYPGKGNIVKVVLDEEQQIAGVLAHAPVNKQMQIVSMGETLHGANTILLRQAISEAVAGGSERVYVYATRNTVAEFDMLGWNKKPGPASLYRYLDRGEMETFLERTKDIKLGVAEVKPTPAVKPDVKPAPTPKPAAGGYKPIKDVDIGFEPLKDWEKTTPDWQRRKAEDIVSGGRTKYFDGYAVKANDPRDVIKVGAMKMDQLVPGLRQELDAALSKVTSLKASRDEAYSIIRGLPSDAPAYRENAGVYRSSTLELDTLTKTMQDRLGKLKSKLVSDSDIAAKRKELENTLTVSPKITSGVRGRVLNSIAEASVLGKENPMRDLRAVRVTERRAYASKDRGYINIGDGNKETAMHEAGHFLEYSNKAMENRNKAFIRMRAEGEPTWLGGGYGRDEKAFPDKFVNPYVGKNYTFDATEVHSVGIQHFISKERMAQLYSADREHFLLTIGNFFI